jgi:hypothetical protein
VHPTREGEYLPELLLALAVSRYPIRMAGEGDSIQGVDHQVTWAPISRIRCWRGELKVCRIVGGAHCRPLSIRWEYAPGAVLMAKEEQRNRTCRP